MKNTLSRMLLSGLIATAIATSSNAGNTSVTALPHIEGFPEIRQFEHLPCPLNLLATSRKLTETGRRQELYKKLSSDQKKAMWKVEYHARLPYPDNVLHRMVEEIRTWNGTPAQYIEMLRADPSLMTTPFKYNNLGPETTIALEAFKYNAQTFLRQMLELGFDPTKYYHVQSHAQRIRQRYAAFARKESLRCYETIECYVKEREKEPKGWFKDLDAATQEKPLILQAEEAETPNKISIPYVERLPPRSEIDDEKTPEVDTSSIQSQEKRAHVHDIFAGVDVAQIAGAIKREYRQRNQEDRSWLDQARTLFNDVTALLRPSERDTQSPEEATTGHANPEALSPWALLL